MPLLSLKQLKSDIDHLTRLSVSTNQKACKTVSHQEIETVLTFSPQEAEQKSVKTTSIWTYFQVLDEAIWFWEHNFDANVHLLWANVVFRGKFSMELNPERTFGTPKSLGDQIHSSSTCILCQDDSVQTDLFALHWAQNVRHVLVSRWMHTFYNRM